MYQVMSKRWKLVFRYWILDICLFLFEYPMSNNQVLGHGNVVQGFIPTEANCGTACLSLALIKRGIFFLGIVAQLLGGHNRPPEEHPADDRIAHGFQEWLGVGEGNFEFKGHGLCPEMHGGFPKEVGSRFQLCSHLLKPLDSQMTKSRSLLSAICCTIFFILLFSVVIRGAGNIIIKDIKSDSNERHTGENSF